MLCRINLPKRKRRDRLKELERASPRESFVEADVETASEASSEQDYSYEFAQMEVIMKTLGNNGMIRIICLLQLRLSGRSCIDCDSTQNLSFSSRSERIMTLLFAPVTVKQYSVLHLIVLNTGKHNHLTALRAGCWPNVLIFVFKRQIIVKKDQKLEPLHGFFWVINCQNPKRCRSFYQMR